MLIRFTVANFLSFKEETVFDMTASAERIHPHHVVRTKSREHPNLLRMGVIYGANAAGKSNLVKALQFVRNFVVGGRGPDARIPVQRFRLDPALLSEPSRFEIEFRIKNMNYAYALVIGQQRIHSEELRTTKTKSETLLFRRTTSANNTIDVQFGSFFDALDPEQQALFRFLERGTRPNQLFLRETIERNEDKFRDIYNWFSKSLTIIEPSTTSSHIEVLLESDEDFRDFICRVLQNAGTGITGVETREQPHKVFDFLPEQLVADLSAQLDEGRFAFIKSPEGHRIVLVKREDDVRVLGIVTKRGDVSFELGEESDGTQRLFDLMPMIHNLLMAPDDQVIVVDEIGRSLHPHLTQLIVNLHLDRANMDRRSQLIITTHETNLLDLNILRRDEIWFAEKKVDGSTDLYSLSDFQPRYDKDIRRDYLVGRYGAIPFIGNVAQLRLPDVEAYEAEPVDAA